MVTRSDGSAGFRFLRGAWPNALVLGAVYALTLSAILAGLQVLTAINRAEVQTAPVSYNMLTCKAADSRAARPLRVYVFNHRQAERVLDALCEDPALNIAFNGVEVVWQHERSEVFASLQGHFDVIVAAPDIVARAPLGTAVLTPIAALSDYDAVWIGDAADRLLDAELLGQLRIGLLRSPVSMSGRVMPEIALRQSGIDVRALDIRMYRGHKDLRAALLSGEVDVIATYWNEKNDSEQFGAFPRRIVGGAQGRRWYVERSLLDSPLHCRIVEALESASQEQSDPYFRDLEVLRPCRA
jgi:phosphonate transport system substrate-binding protein